MTTQEAFEELDLDSDVDFTHFRNVLYLFIFIALRKGDTAKAGRGHKAAKTILADRCWMTEREAYCYLTRIERLITAACLLLAHEYSMGRSAHQYVNQR